MVCDEGTEPTLIVTSSNDGVHPPLLIVHLSTFAPVPSPVTAEVGLDGVVIVAVPLITLHAPVPIVAVLPANVVLFEGNVIY
jgi:hypothetical protein